MYVAAHTLQLSVNMQIVLQLHVRKYGVRQYEDYTILKLMRQKLLMAKVIFTEDHFICLDFQ